MDRRLTPANDRVAHESLRGKVEGLTFVTGHWQSVGAPVANLLREPGGARERQLLMGARVLVLERTAGHAFVQAAHDGYVGYLNEADLAPDINATHWVSAPATHLYSGPSIKSPDLASLSLGSRLAIVAEKGDLAETRSGAFVPLRHIRHIGDWADDPVTVAEGFLGTPYLWGGNSRAGIDCSGLIQVAYLACGLDCPGDSDLQEASLGAPLPADEPLRRGDLLFWKGHVALVADEARILHATGYPMAVVHEGTKAAIARIERQSGGPVTSRRRVSR